MHKSGNPQKILAFSTIKPKKKPEGGLNDDMYPQKSEGSKELTYGFKNMIVECMIPLSIVDSAAFKKFMAVLDNRYVVPNRRTTTLYLANNVKAVK